MLNDEPLIAKAVKTFTTSSDEIVVEFTGILLGHICDDPKRVDSLGRDEILLKSIFGKLKSHDPDILLHSIRLLNVVMRNSILIESVLAHKDFPFKNLQIELKNEIWEVQVAALESLLLISTQIDNPFWDVLGSDRMVAEVYVICTVRFQ